MPLASRAGFPVLHRVLVLGGRNAGQAGDEEKEKEDAGEAPPRFGESPGSLQSRHSVAAAAAAVAVGTQKVAVKSALHTPRELENKTRRWVHEKPH